MKIVKTLQNNIKNLQNNMKNISNNAKLSLDHIWRRCGRACALRFCRRGGILAKDGENVGFLTCVHAALHE